MSKVFCIILAFLISSSVFADWKIDVKSVYDGDTITADIHLGLQVVLANQKIRLLYIDAPEARGFFKKKGEKSREHLIGLLKDKEVYLSVDPKEKERDSFGRVLGILKVGDVVINSKMIEDGFAVPYKK
jgi:endonuclease YncB( thermonuclease family)